MKTYNYNEVATEVEKQLQEAEFTISELLSVNEIQILVFNIYITADMPKAHAFDCITPAGNLSLIWTETKLSLIYDGKATRRTLDNLCIYESLEDDVAGILFNIELCFQIIDNLYG